MKSINSTICVLLIIGPVFFLIACTSGRWIYVQPSPTIPYSYIKNYELGKTKSAYIGQEIIKVSEFPGNHSKKFFSKQSITIDIEYRFYYSYHIKTQANREYLSDETMKIDNNLYYLIKLFDDKHRPWGIFVTPDGVVFSQAVYSYEYKMLFYNPQITFTPDVLNIDFSTRKEKKIPLNSISYELIYFGKNDVSLNIAYKEYTPINLKEATFFQKLTYQVNANQINFKDFVIQIQNVTDEKITYTVIEDGID
jgi:hypothetical protein